MNFLACLGLLVLAAASCARVAPPKNRRRLIVGGQDASDGEFPYMCSLRSSIGGHVCGATLISSRLALTAAYCVSPPTGIAKPLLYCGLHKLHTQPSGTFDVLQAVRTSSHEAFDSITYCNDVAVLELNSSAVHGMPIGGTINQLNYSNGYPLTAIGWGYAKSNIESSPAQADQLLSNTLQHAKLPFLPYSICNSPLVYSGAVEEACMFCAGHLDGSADTCNGDSGGALVDLRGSNSSGDHRQAGIVSWGKGCAQAGWPGVYARLDTFAPFMASHGYCSCTSTGLSGTADTSTHGCVAGLLQQEQQAGTQAVDSGSMVQKPACYVVDPTRCSYSIPSKLFPGAAYAPCDSSTNLTMHVSQSVVAPAEEVAKPFVGKQNPVPQVASREFSRPPHAP